MNRQRHKTMKLKNLINLDFEIVGFFLLNMFLEENCVYYVLKLELSSWAELGGVGRSWELMGGAGMCFGAWEQLSEHGGVHCVAHLAILEYVISHSAISAQGMLSRV